MNVPRGVNVAIFLALACSWAWAQEAVDASKYVSREEYEALKKQMAAMQAEVAEMRKTNVDAAVNADRLEMVDEMSEQIKTLQHQTNFLTSGATKFFLTGDAAVNFTSPRGSPSTFGAKFNPLFLVQLDDRLFFEGGLDIAGSTNPDDQSSTTVGLTEANISYLVNKNLAVGGGWFTLPFARFHNNYDASWINRLPDEPLPFGDRGIAPGNGMGLFAEGAAPLGRTQINYAAYVINGPSQITNSGENAGTLNFDSFDDLNNNKAVGGRIGWQPTTGSEIGYSIMGGRVNPNGFQRVDGVLQAVDAQYRKEIARLYGTIDTRAEWVWSNVSKATFDPTGALMFGPLRFNNDRNGGYVQVSYRPTVLRNKYLRNIEPVIRYDTLEGSSHAPGGGDECRLTLGLDYWVKANAVFKIAYECDNMKDAPDQDAFLAQFAIGL